VIAGDNGRKSEAVCEHCEDVNGLCGVTNEVVLERNFRLLAMLSIVQAVKLGTC
jgi:hypothetical protein